VLRRRAANAASKARARSRSLIADPLVVATGVQVLQAIGASRALTLLAIKGGALALASRPAACTEREGQAPVEASSPVASIVSAARSRR
jgi:hypothetical protein